MIAHPIAVFIFSLANITTGLAWLFGAATLIPRTAGLSKRTRLLGSIALAGSGLAHLGLALLVVFFSDTTAAQVSTLMPVLGMQLIIATTTWLFLARIYLEAGPKATPVFGPPSDTPPAD